MAKRYREKCLEEKGEQCELCGADSEVEVHHIDGDRQNNSLDNLIPVCKECHRGIHLNRPGVEKWHRKLKHDKGWGGLAGVEGDSLRTTASFGQRSAERIEQYAEEHETSHAQAVRYFVREGLEKPFFEEQNEDLREKTADMEERLEEKDRLNTQMEREIQMLRQQIDKKDERIEKLLDAIISG